MADRRLIAVLAACAAGLAGSAAWSDEEERITLHLFGPEMPVMFHVTGGKKDFAWSEITRWGDVGVGTISDRAGEVVGVDGEFFVADANDPTPRRLSDETTPAGTVVTFTPQHSLTIDAPVDLAGLQSALDAQFVDTGTFVFMFKARAVLTSVEYQLEGPTPTDEVINTVKSGQSQKAVTLNTPKHTAQNLAATLIGIRAPPYLNTVFEIPYHIHFLADDRSALGHVTALDATEVEVEWTRTEAINIRYWDTE